MNRKGFTCLDCKHIGTKWVDKFHCKKNNMIYNRGDRFFTCLFFEEKGGDDGAQTVDTQTKQTDLELRGQSTQEKQNINARRD